MPDLDINDTEVLTMADGVNQGMHRCGMSAVAEEAANSEVSKCINFDADNPPVAYGSIDVLSELSKAGIKDPGMHADLKIDPPPTL